MKVEIRTETLTKTFDRWKSDLNDRGNLKKPQRTFIFEDEDDYWNALASIFLHHYWEKSFRRFSTFSNEEADPFFSEPREAFLFLSDSLPKTFEEKAPQLFGKILRSLKPKMRWPWTYRFVDIMGTVGVRPFSSEYVVAMGLVQPMEHLAFLTSAMESPLFPQVSEDGTISLLQDGNLSKGNVTEFRFRLPSSEENDERVAGLRKTLDQTPEKVTIFFPTTFEDWASMRDSYENAGIWSAADSRGIVFSVVPDRSSKKTDRFEPSRSPRSLPSEPIRWNQMAHEKTRSLSAASL